MSKRLMFAAAIAFAATAQFASAAVAGEWGGFGCGRCAPAYAPGAVYYTAPTYTYLQPIVTVVPHYVVQPNYIVNRTYVLRPTRVIEDNALPCIVLCGEGYVVNQGQYPVRETPASWTAYPPAHVRHYPYRYRRAYYRHGAPSHYHTPAHYSIVR